MSPSKAMIEDNKNKNNIPFFIDDTKELLKTLKTLSADSIEDLMSISESISRDVISNIDNFKFDEFGTPAIYAYTGIQYRSISINSMDCDDIQYIKSNIKILSGLYGILDAFDSVYKYRLDMLSKIKFNEKSLYDFWGDKIYSKIKSFDDIIINVSSKEYSKLIDRYICDDDCNIFNVEFKQVKQGKLKNVSSTDSKKIRGIFVNYIIKNKLKNVNKLKLFNHSGYLFSEVYSTENKLVFTKNK